MIRPYWEGKSLEDVLRSRYGKEIDQIAKVVKINQRIMPRGISAPTAENGWRKVRPVSRRKRGSGCRRHPERRGHFMKA